MALNDKTRKHNDMDFQKDLSEILTNAKIGLWAIEMDEGKSRECISMTWQERSLDFTRI